MCKSWNTCVYVGICVFSYMYLCYGRVCVCISAALREDVSRFDEKLDSALSRFAKLRGDFISMTIYQKRNKMETSRQSKIGYRQSSIIDYQSSSTFNRKLQCLSTIVTPVFKHQELMLCDGLLRTCLIFDL